MKTIISLIAAIDENRGMGKDNQLPWHLPADLKHFKALTRGKPIIMGRKTFDSIGRPLPERMNIVLTRCTNHTEGVCLAHSLSEAFQQCEASPEVMVIGGGDVFQQALPYATSLYLTLIHHTFPADVYFPLVNESEWLNNTATLRPADEQNPYAMTFMHYIRK